MGWFSFLICVAAAYLMFQVGRGVGIVALVIAGLNFWSLGIMHNYYRFGGVGSSYERFVVTLNMLTTITGVVLLIIGLVKGC